MLVSSTVSFCAALCGSANHKKPGLSFDVCMKNECYERKSKVGNIIKDSNTKGCKWNKPYNTKEIIEPCLSWPRHRVKEEILKITLKFTMKGWLSLRLLVQVYINYLNDPKESQAEIQVVFNWQNKAGRHKHIFSGGNKPEFRTSHRSSFKENKQLTFKDHKIFTWKHERELDETDQHFRYWYH